MWMPGRYLAHPSTEVVLSVALPRHVPSPRFKEVVHPTAQQWLHHLEGLAGGVVRRGRVTVARGIRP